jgi:N6-adenosine-specific RNA methylase IME4
MSVSLIKYDAARKALAEAHRVDEVKDIRDRALAMRVYAKQAKDTDLINHATDIRLPAERQAGELLAEMKEKGERKKSGDNQHGGSNSENLPPSLSELGVTKIQSHRWQKLAELDEDEFEEKVEQAKRRQVSTLEGLAKPDKAVARVERERELQAKQCALPRKKYGVIVADPEWRFEPWSRKTGMDRSADNHYPTSCTEAITKRDVASIAANDCVLFLWATAPMMPHALLVMDAWGFEYRWQQIWRKDKLGTDYWFRNLHEHLLVGVKGNIPAPAPGDNKPSVIDAPRGKHSEKPEIFLEMIERLYPSLPKIELNRRGAAAARLGCMGQRSKLDRAARGLN